MIVDCNVDIVAVIDFYTNSNIIGIDFVLSVCVQTLNKNSDKNLFSLIRENFCLGYSS